MTRIKNCIAALMVLLATGQVTVFAFNREQKSCAAAGVAACIVGFGNYYYDRQAEKEPEVGPDGKPIVSQWPPNKIKKYTKKQCIQRSLLRALAAGSLVGCATYCCLPSLSKVDLRLKALEESTQIPYQGKIVIYECTRYVGYNIGTGKFKTKFIIVNKDTLDYAQDLIEQNKKNDFKFVVLDMANEYSPGGGARTGCTAQEEQLCYRSNLLLPLDRCRECVPFPSGNPHKKAFIEPEGAIYVPGVTVTKASEANKFKILSQSYQIDVIVSAACDLRKETLQALKLPNKHDYGKSQAYDKLMQEKIRTQLRVALLHGHKNLVLSAFGCGAFENDPEIVSRFYDAIFKEAEFEGAFNTIVFAIYASGPNDKNLATFARTFGKKFWKGEFK